MFVLTLCPHCTSVVVLPASPSAAARCRACRTVVSAGGGGRTAVVPDRRAPAPPLRPAPVPALAA